MERLAHLVVAAQAGDLDAFSALFRQFQDMAYAAAYAKLGDHHRAQDAAQEAFVEAFVNLPKLKEPAAFPGWFRQIVFRQCIRAIRSSSHRVVPLEDALEVASEDPQPDQAVQELELRQRVHAAVLALPESQRMVTALFYIHGYSYKKIAEFLGLPISTVKKRLHLARKRLHQQMLDLVESDLQENRPSGKEQFSRSVQMLVAARAGDLKKVRTLLRQDPSLLHTHDSSGRTPLHLALEGSHTRLVQLLRKKGATEEE